MKKHLLIIIFFVFISFSNLLFADIPPSERAALIALYNSTTGDSWTDNTSWKTPPLDVDGFAMPGTENTWYGVTCNGGNTEVNQIELNSNNLAGNIPSSLEDLSSLSNLNLLGNQLNGSIPSQLGNISALTRLNLAGNQLSGTIPATLANLSIINYLYLNNNQLSGNIPSQLGNLSFLLRLYLDNNNLNGTIPIALGDLNALEILRLGSNSLSGAIPSQLGNLAGLTELNLSRNSLSGTIPQDLGNLSNLEELIFNGNQITGDIPAALSSLTSLINGDSDFSYNGIYTNNNTTRTFLNSKQTGGNWENSQTIAPGNITTSNITFNSIRINWSVIPYSGDSGYYTVHYGETSGGPYNSSINTTDKTNTQLTITPLSEGTTYYFVVDTQTDPHAGNSNTIVSDYSTEVSATTLSTSISGSVTTSGAQGVENVNIDFSNGGGSASTNSSGNYNNNVTNGWTGTATPSLAGYTFAPANRSYSNVVVDQTSQNYIATPITYIVSGRITDSGGSGLSNVQLSFSNGGWTTTTDSNGDYSQVVTYNWSGTVTPTRAGYYFTPTYRAYSNVLSNQTSQNYTTAGIANTISGLITDGSGSGLSNVELTFSNNAGTVVTNSNGEYSHNVAYNWSGDVIPSKKSYLFSPSSKSYTKVKSNFSNQDYRAEAITPIISGRITDNEGNGIGNVVISFSNIDETVITDNNGKYSHAVPFNWSGTITPIKKGFSFSPDSYSYTNTVLNQTNQDFIIIQEITLSISAIRKTDSAWIVQIQYGELELIVKKGDDDIQVSKYVIYRKISGFEYEIIKELSDSSIQDEKIVYLDKNLEENLNYTYKVVALNSNGDIIGSSNESTI